MSIIYVTARFKVLFALVSGVRPIGGMTTKKWSNPINWNLDKTEICPRAVELVST